MKKDGKKKKKKAIEAPTPTKIFTPPPPVDANDKPEPTGVQLNQRKSKYFDFS